MQDRLQSTKGDLRALALGAHTKNQDVWGKKKGRGTNNVLLQLETAGIEAYALDYAMRLVWNLQRNGNDIIQCKLSTNLTKIIRNSVMEVLDEIMGDIVAEHTFDVPDPVALEKQEKEKRERAIADLKNQKEKHKKIQEQKEAREARMREKLEQGEKVPDIEITPTKESSIEGTPSKTKTKEKKRKKKTESSSKKHDGEIKKKKSKSGKDKQISGDKKLSREKKISGDKKISGKKKSSKRRRKDKESKAAEAEDVNLESKERKVVNQTISDVMKDQRKRQFATLPSKGRARPVLKRGGGIEDNETVPTIKITRELADIFKLNEQIEAKIISTFSKPLEVPSSTGKDFLDFYHLSVQGPRPANEDEYSVVEHVNEFLNFPEIKDTYSYFGVFDGHSGKYTSLVTRSQLFWNLFSHKEFPSDKAFEDAFIQTDKLVNDAQERDNFCCGTTALSVCIRNNRELIVGNVGDCRGFLCRSGEAVEISSPHNLDKEAEKERIKALGGAVVWFGTWRVNGILAVSRSIGDCNLKDLVIAKPDVTRIPITRDDEFLVVASDGLWDGISGAEMIEIVKKEVAENGRANVCKALCDTGIEKKTNDNVTAVVVFFNHDKA